MLGQVGGWVSDSCEGGTAEDFHSNDARLLAVAILEGKGVQGLDIIWVSLQVHLAQKLIFQDSVVPDLGGNRGLWEGPSSSLGVGTKSTSHSASLAEEKEPWTTSDAWARPCPFCSLSLIICQSSLPHLQFMNLLFSALLLTLGDCEQVVCPLPYCPHF